VKIETGEPRATGRYACFMHGVPVATVLRDWTGAIWQGQDGKAVAGTVAGWIGPLPSWPENSVSQPAKVFDL
jgi:hypothetical protein